MSCTVIFCHMRWYIAKYCNQTCSNMLKRDYRCLITWKPVIRLVGDFFLPCKQIWWSRCRWLPEHYKLNPSSICHIVVHLFLSPISLHDKTDSMSNRSKLRKGLCSSKLQDCMVQSRWNQMWKNVGPPSKDINYWNCGPILLHIACLSSSLKEEINHWIQKKKKSD